MLARIEDLRKGDVVIIASASQLFEAKLVRQPKLAAQGRKLTWDGKPRWTSVLCSIREEVEVVTYNNGKHQYTKRILVVANGKPYTRDKRIDFTRRSCWLIKREEQ
jgi:hypothetical protein